MILLTKLDNHKILVSLATIKYLESIPDTLIFFTNGDSVIVKESLPEIEQAVVKFQSAVHSHPNNPNLGTA